MLLARWWVRRRHPREATGIDLRGARNTSVHLPFAPYFGDDASVPDAVRNAAPADARRCPRCGAGGATAAGESLWCADCGTSWPAPRPVAPGDGVPVARAADPATAAIPAAPYSGDDDSVPDFIRDAPPGTVVPACPNCTEALVGSLNAWYVGRTVLTPCSFCGDQTIGQIVRPTAPENTEPGRTVPGANPPKHKRDVGPKAPK